MEEQGDKKLSIFDCWQLRMREVTSPQAFVDFGIYFAVAAYLQRRVWTNADHQKLYPNIYPILVADPGVGKGLVIKPVMELIKKHKLTDALSKPIDMSSATSVSNAAIEANDFAKAGESSIKLPRERLRIPIGPDNGTYESVVKICAESSRSIGYKRYDKNLDKVISDVYRHNSLAFGLEEMSSFLHKDASKAMNFLVKAYDCGDYSYTTISRGEDYIKQVCMNFLAGTTPKFIENSFDSGIMEEGFAARAWFIYAPRNRFYLLRSPELTPEQLEAQARIEEHMLGLTKIYGYAPMTDEAWQYLENWWEKEQSVLGYKRPNMSDKLNTYYGRKNIHLMKMAMILHFMEDNTVAADGFSPANPITLAEVKRAMAVLDAIEVNMHMALQYSGANPLHKLSKRIVAALRKTGPMSGDQVLLEFWAESPTSNPAEGITETLRYLQDSKQIGVEEKTMKWYVKD
jgi:hypothetical protein